VTFNYGGRRIRAGVGNAVFALLDGAPVNGGGICVTHEDVR
jgi:hypothetical protein